MPKRSYQRNCDYWDFTKCSDLVLVVENNELHVHREILCFHSPVFQVMLEADFKEKSMERIPLPGKHVDQVMELLNFVYPLGYEISGKRFLFDRR